MTIKGRFKRYFFRGMAVLLPTILTIWIFVLGFTFIQKNISVHINRGIVQLIMFLRDYHDIAARDALNKFWVRGPGSLAGFVVALVAVCVVGAMLASVVGRTLWRMIEKSIMNAPILRLVYPYVKQITDFLLSQEKQEKLFSGVVAVEYPRKGIWSIGMVTGPGIKKITDKEGKEFLTVFIATSPSPLTGFAIVVPKDETVDIGMTVEEAIRFIISGGVISPGTKRYEQVADLSKADTES
jgi:uncharacterized membrane protein